MFFDANKARKHTFLGLILYENALIFSVFWSKKPLLQIIIYHHRGQQSSGFDRYLIGR